MPFWCQVCVTPANEFLIMDPCDGGCIVAEQDDAIDRENMDPWRGDATEKLNCDRVLCSMTQEEEKALAEAVQQDYEERVKAEQAMAKTARARLLLTEALSRQEAAEAMKALDGLERKWAREAQEEKLRHERKQADAKRVSQFLSANSFKHVNDKRRRWTKSSTPLHCAVARKDPELIRCLLEAGADRSIKVFGRTALELARSLEWKDKKTYAAVARVLQWPMSAP
eukprot:TRINITY_DN2113_c3_g1_i1.p1 TRINITY_DN2113_c3_g1~~TRINITY_DN2113_c3_g1_i1.p1  ORF type:complete len:226 (+),score=48.92 TRINITY_DN2113_c3_g1_i1:72-749(+)